MSFLYWKYPVLLLLDISVYVLGVVNMILLKLLIMGHPWQIHRFVCNTVGHRTSRLLYILYFHILESDTCAVKQSMQDIYLQMAIYY
jgi:hypothetical protein